MSKIVSAVLAVSILPLAGCASDRAGAVAGPHAIEASKIEAHMRFLASDELEGRATATSGYLRAVEYVVERFEEIGLEPAGDDGGFYQSVPLIAGHLVADDSRLALLRDGTETLLEIETDCVLEPDFLRQGAELTAPLAYVGFGVRAPEFDYDDYAGIDVEGKIVVMLRGAPARFPHDERAFYSSSEMKKQTAVDLGAVGLINMLLPSDRENDSWERTVTLSRMPSMRRLTAGGRPHAAHEALFVVATLSTGGEAALFAGEERTLDQVFAAAEAGQPFSFNLASRLSVLAATQHKD